jgi:hypothetical protein
MGQTKQKSSTNQTTSQVKDPYAPAKPLINQSIGGVQDWLNNPMSSEAYTGGMSDMTKEGLGLLGGAQGAKTSSAYLTDVIGGKYLNADNPHQAAMDEAIKASVMPGINSSFSANGMGGSTMHQGMLMKGLTQGMAAPRYQQYQNERNAMGQAAGMLPGVDAMAGEQVLRAGQYQDAFDRGQWEDQRMAGLRPYLETGGLLQGYGNMGGSSQGTSQGTTTSSSNPSLGSQILGGGMMGLGMMGGMPGLGMGGMMGAFNGGNAPQGSLPWQQGYSPFYGSMTGN